MTNEKYEYLHPKVILYHTFWGKTKTPVIKISKSTQVLEYNLYFSAVFVSCFCTVLYI